MDSQKFGTFISELRKERGWTQLELAQKLNVTDGRNTDFVSFELLLK